MGDDRVRWGFARRFGFLFLFLFFGLYITPIALGFLPVIDELVMGAYLLLWEALMPILGNAALGITEPIQVGFTGSDDMLWRWVQLLWYATFAVVGALVWTTLDRKRGDYAALYAWLRIALRYWLALIMFGYGLIKVFGQQFEALGPIHLGRSYGESSPAGLLWTFMGFSPVYRGFTGMAEILAGALLLSRRTTPLGSLVAVAVMSNVVMMNLCYDVPVKTLSSLLLLAALLLTAHDARRIVDALVLNRPTPASDLRAPVLGPRLRRARVAAKIGFVLLIVWTAIQTAMAVAQRQARAAPGPFYGAWAVERITLDGAPPTSDEARWRQFAVPAYPMAVVRRARGEALLFALEHDVAASTITLTELNEVATAHVLQVARPAADELVLSGSMGAAIEVHLRRIDTEHAPLVTRGFHWITEEPYNR